MSDASFRALTHLRDGLVFSNLADEQLQALAACLIPVDIARGEILMSEGDPPGDAWIVVTGRLEVSTHSGGRTTTIAELGPGSVVGEMALLSGSRRSASVRAVRNCRLLRLNASDFHRVALQDPQVVLGMARTVVQRLEQSIHDHKPRPRPSVAAIIPAGTEPDHEEFAARFAEVPGPFERVVVVRHGDVASDAAGLPREAELTEFLHRIEADHDLTVLVAEAADSDWTRRCVRHADATLLVGRASGLRERGPAEVAAVEERSEHGYAERHLVVLHSDGRPRGTRAYLRPRDVDRHHHVTTWSTADLQRVSRIVGGATVGMVLGGGGAKGFAHLGVLKALIEAGIPIDHVGGASIGAVVAGIYASGWDWEEMAAKARMVTVDRGSLIDPVFPAVALASGQRLKRAIQDLYHDSDIEDMRTDFFCVSTDLTNGALQVHSVGPMWRAIRASVAIPGVFPPMRGSARQVLVDGGVLNNLPADVMRELFDPATVIASDVQGSSQLPVEDLGSDGVVSGWTVLGRRYAPRKEPMQLPRMIDLLTSATAATGRHGATYADLVFQPPVGRYAILDFQSHAAILEAGYRHAAATLEEWSRPASCEPPVPPDEIKRRLGE